MDHAVAAATPGQTPLVVLTTGDGRVFVIHQERI